MIKAIRHIAPYKTGLYAIMLLLLVACGGSKKVPEQSIYSQRKVFRSLFHEANSEKMIGHYEKAIGLFEQCLAMEANNPAVHFALADLYEIQGNKEKTLTYAQQAYELDKSNKWYTLRLADLYYEAEDFSKTADLYETVIEDEKNIDLKYKYTDALIRANRFEKAILMLNEIEVETGKTPEGSFTKHDLFMQLGKPDEAKAELEALMNEYPTDYEYQIMVAEFYMQQGNFLKSTQLIQEILEADPKNGQAYIMLADLELRQDNVSGAFKNLAKGFESEDVELDRKLEILRGLIPYTAKNQRDYREMRAGVKQLFEIVYDPEIKNGRMHEYYGLFYTSLEDFANAEKQYQLACDLSPASFDTWLQLLTIQKKVENYAGMHANGKKAADLFAAQPIIYLLTGIGAKETKQFSEAEEWLFLGKDLVVQDPQLQSEFLYQLGDMNYMQGNPDEGKFYFNQAIQTFPGNVNVYADNAKRAMQNNTMNEAEAALKQGLAAVPNSALLLDLYGQFYFKQKDYKRAEEKFGAALKEDFSDGTVLEHFADAMYFNGEKEKAIELWGEAIKYGNKSEVLKRKYEDKTYYESE